MVCHSGRVAAVLPECGFTYSDSKFATVALNGRSVALRALHRASPAGEALERTRESVDCPRDLASDHTRERSKGGQTGRGVVSSAIRTGSVG